MAIELKYNTKIVTNWLRKRQLIAAICASLMTMTSFLMPETKFEKELQYRSFNFKIVSTDTGAIRRVTITIANKGVVISTVRQKVDGFLVNAEVADLDVNGHPELYYYSVTSGTGSFGRFYGFQFYPDHFAPIRLGNVPTSFLYGYMGHDDFRIENRYLVRTFPLYKSGNTNAYPTGGIRTIRYGLRLDDEKKLVLDHIGAIDTD
jgi:hypothetical protein